MAKARNIIKPEVVGINLHLSASEAAVLRAHLVNRELGSTLRNIATVLSDEALAAAKPIMVEE